MKSIVTKGLLALTAAVVLPTVGSASTLFTFTALLGSPGTVNLTTGIAQINFDSYSIGSSNYNAPTNTSTFNETYNNTTGVLAFSGMGATGTPFANLSGTFLTIDEAPGLLTGQSFPLSALSLYSGVTNVIYGANFLSDLGITGPAVITSANVSVSTGGSGSSGSQTVSSTASVFTAAAATPEPSSFAMFGIAAILVGVGAAHGKLRFKLSAK
jgi:hypothetical protein